MPPVPLVLQNVLDAYHALCHRVHCALLTQAGDSYRLGIHRRECIQLLEDVTMHGTTIPDNEQDVMVTSLYTMHDALVNAMSTSTDQPDQPHTQLGERAGAGGRGRPRVAINPHDLALFTTGRARNTDLATIYDCSARTIRRRRLEFGLSRPGNAVYTEQLLPDGQIERTYHPGRASDLSDLTNDELDSVVLSIYYQFPSFGRGMFDGYLLELGERVPRQRLEESYRRVVGPPTRTFAPRRLIRRVYNVPGPNSLWHHDGQHGLIRWKIVIHAFIDGFSRYVLGIRASDNNRASTVLLLFLGIVFMVGYPSRIRGDHGGENQLVAAAQEEVRGPDRGSYIRGKSVHNIRIERLWVDVTQGFGGKWKGFFQLLEIHHGLDVDNDAHIWLVHHIFLPMINADADAWMRTWNQHVLARRGEQHLSPHNLYVRGMAASGRRGLHPESVFQAPVHQEDPVVLNEDEQAGYGIDWDEMDVPNVLNHHRERHAQAESVADEPNNPFLSQDPGHMPHIVWPDVRCPFAPEQITQLDAHLNSSLPQEVLHTVDMEARMQIWDVALAYCIQLATH